jgi:hypothetical protein
MPIKKLHKARFDALCYSRQPLAHAVSQEVEWYADQKENVLGIPIDLFPYCSHHYIRDGKRVALLPNKFVYESKTMIITPKK